MLCIESENQSGVTFPVGVATDAIARILRSEGVEDGWVGFQLVTPERIRALKREHLGLDEETDALAFPIDGGDPLPEGMPRHVGEIVLCPEVVGDAWRAPLVHAVLHLVGYDHGAEMEARERAHA
jgi:probable rRNA maturation factor